MAWHMGHPLSQTLFTSIYLDKLLWPVPRTWEDARFDRMPSESPLVGLVLRAYCLALIKACDFVHARVAAEYYYEVGQVQSLRYAHNIDRLLLPRKRILSPNCIIATYYRLLTHPTSTACWTRRLHGLMSKIRLTKSFEMPFDAGYCSGVSSCRRLTKIWTSLILGQLRTLSPVCLIWMH